MPVSGGAVSSPVGPGGLRFTIEFESVTGCDLSNTGLLMWIGRDVLRQALFVYDGVSGEHSIAL